MKRLAASLGHGLLWLAIAYVIWGLIVRHRYVGAWSAPKVGDSVPTVINRFGAPDNLEAPLKFTNPEYCATARPTCSDPFTIRLWYQLPFTVFVGGHVLVIDFDDRARRQQV